MLKHSFLNKSLQPPFIIVYGFETMIVETDNQSKLQKLRKKKFNNDNHLTLAITAENLKSVARLGLLQNLIALKFPALLFVFVI